MKGMGFGPPLLSPQLPHNGGSAHARLVPNGFGEGRFRNTVDKLMDGAEVLGVQVNVIPMADGLIPACIECEAAAPRDAGALPAAAQIHIFG